MERVVYYNTTHNKVGYAHNNPRVYLHVPVGIHEDFMYMYVCIARMCARAHVYVHRVAAARNFGPQLRLHIFDVV